MEIKNMTIEELQSRKAELSDLINGETEDLDLDAMETEARSINEELEARAAAAAEKAEIRNKIAEGADPEAKEIEKQEERKDMYTVDSLEYRNAWVKNMIGREVDAEERAALASASAVIPTMTANAIWDKLIKPAELLGKVDVSQFPNYVRFPKATTVNVAAGQAVGGTITESSDVIDYVDLIPNEYVKLLTVGADIEHMAIDAIHDWIVSNLVGSIRYAINKDILVGTGTNALKGITATIVSATATTLDKAGFLKIMGALGGQYQEGAIWVMTPAMFFENVMAMTQLNDYVVNDGFQYKLFGHDVVLMSEAKVGNAENVFYGDPSAYKVNIFKALDVKPFETATTTNIQFRGACLADGELIDSAAFVRYAPAAQG